MRSPISLRVCVGVAVLAAVVPAPGCQSTPRVSEAVAPTEETPAAEPEAVTADSDPRAVELALAVMGAMGGHEAWDSTRFVRWRFSGNRCAAA